MAEEIILEQALFGYRDGHNLLAVSTSLTAEARQFLATVTDSSGPESASGFENAFTGLPVPESDFYALFCTWPAPEMPRPGCVWSHVILIRLADLARIPELLLLRSLFSRPTVPIQAALYERPLIFDLLENSAGNDAVADTNRTAILIRALYEHPESEVAILDMESVQWEKPIFKIWSQQWPRLRREFAFSTGSLGDRRLAGVAFDLQIAPVTSERIWRRSDSPTLLLDYRALSQALFQTTAPRWVASVLKDSQDGSPTELKRFLFDYGSDIEEPRAAFAKLASIFDCLVESHESGWASLLSLVSISFPSQMEAVRLKRWLLSVPATSNSVETLERTLAVVSFLLDSPDRDAYPKIDFDFASSAVVMWNERREQTVSLLSRLAGQDETAAATSFAEAIARTVDSATMQSIAERHVELIPIVIRHNPKLAFEVDTWRLRGYAQDQVYETLAKISLGREDWGRIVGAMLVAATHVSVRDAVAMAGDCAMSGAFRWLENPVSKEMLPSHFWRDALASSALETLNTNENLPLPQFAFCAWCAPTDKLRQNLSARRRDIQALAAESLDVIPAPLRLPAAFIMMTIGLREATDAGAQLIFRSVYIVHDSLASGSHSSESWWLLSRELPDLGWRRDWDRCEKLRRAVHNWLTRHGMTEKQLLRFASSPVHLRIAQQIPVADDSANDFLD